MIGGHTNRHGGIGGLLPVLSSSHSFILPAQSAARAEFEFDCRGEISASLSKKRRGRVARLSLSLRMCAERRYKLLSCRS